MDNKFELNTHCSVLIKSKKEFNEFRDNMIAMGNDSYTESIDSFLKTRHISSKPDRPAVQLRFPYFVEYDGFSHRICRVPKVGNVIIGIDDIQSLTLCNK